MQSTQTDSLKARSAASSSRSLPGRARSDSERGSIGGGPPWMLAMSTTQPASRKIQ